MLARINLPREAVLLSGLYMVCFNFLIRLALLVAVFVWFQITPPLTVLLAPVGVVALIALGFVIGLAITPLGVLYQDVKNSLPLFTQMLLFLTPVIYAPSDSGILGFLSTYNPVAPLITVSRAWLVDMPATQMEPFIIISACVLFVLLAGWTVFRLAMPHLIARMPN
jgi:lipopolysaccharide transport system permease protein